MHRHKRILLIACAAACLVYGLQLSITKHRLKGPRKHNIPVIKEIWQHSSVADEVDAANNPWPFGEQLASLSLVQEDTKCLGYNEFRRLNFQHESFKDILCINAEAYKRLPDGYPLCKLPNPFDMRLLQIVRVRSSAADLLDASNKSVRIFVYKERDYISEAIRTWHRWEPETVHATLRFAERVPNATFLDAGCNIGVYSVLAARLGLPVISLDANIRNLLRLRLTLSAASLDASLVWNFIGSGDQLSYLNFPEDCNVGGATKFGRAVRDTIPVMPVRSDRLCSIIGTKHVVIKLDVEGGEADFLRTSGRLFSEFNVAAVQMEWLPKHMVGNDNSTIINFFTSRGYSAWMLPELFALKSNSSSEWLEGDLVWVHVDFQHLVAEVRALSS